MTYRFYEGVLKDLIYKMMDKNSGPQKVWSDMAEFIGCNNLKFVMNYPLYNDFSNACKMTGHDSDMYKGIKIIQDSSMYVGDSVYPDGIVRLVYEEPEGVKFMMDLHKYCHNDAKVTYESFKALDRGHGFQRVPHIDHVIFNGPATIVFWKDGTKTVVKINEEYLDDRRKAILYAFIRKIYGEGRPYHNILNEIEEALNSFEGIIV
jgi:hypothetical protein